MKIKHISFLLLYLVLSCSNENKISSLNSENWSKRVANSIEKDSLEHGKSYLSIYSQIYSLSELKTTNLTAMASIRNTSESDTIYILRAEYYDTKGNSVRKYFNRPIFLTPLETVEIVIDEVDTSGGTGSNFIFEWKVPIDSPEPLFEGVMSSTKSQQGLSFTTQAKRIE